MAIIKAPKKPAEVDASSAGTAAEAAASLPAAFLHMTEASSTGNEANVDWQALYASLLFNANPDPGLHWFAPVPKTSGSQPQAHPPKK